MIPKLLNLSTPQNIETSTSCIIIILKFSCKGTELANSCFHMQHVHVARTIMFNLHVSSLFYIKAHFHELCKHLRIVHDGTCSNFLQCLHPFCQRALYILSYTKKTMHIVVLEYKTRFQRPTTLFIFRFLHDLLAIVQPTVYHDFVHAPSCHNDTQELTRLRRIFSLFSHLADHLFSHSGRPRRLT